MGLVFVTVSFFYDNIWRNIWQTIFVNLNLTKYGGVDGVDLGYKIHILYYTLKLR